MNSRTVMGLRFFISITVRLSCLIPTTLQQRNCFSLELMKDNRFDVSEAL
jgi:hypothetical protein